MKQTNGMNIREYIISVLISSLISIFSMVLVFIYAEFNHRNSEMDFYKFCNYGEFRLEGANCIVDIKIDGKNYGLVIAKNVKGKFIIDYEE